MKIEIWPKHGPLNSKPVFEAFIKSLKPEEVKNIKRRSSAEDATGYLGKIDHARKIFEKLYNT